MGLSHLGSLMFCWKPLRETWCMSRCFVVMKLQSLVDHSCGLRNLLNSFCRGMFTLNAKFDADSLLCSLSHLQCNSYTVHMLTQWRLSPSWLVQWSCHHSCMCILVHSSWLPGYISMVQTVLIILAIAGLFPDRPHILHDFSEFKVN